MRNGTRQKNGQILYYWLVLSEPLETAGELFSMATKDATTVVRCVCESLREGGALPPGTHRIAISCVRGDGSAFLVWSGDVEVGAVACA